MMLPSDVKPPGVVSASEMDDMAQQRGSAGTGAQIAFSLPCFDGNGSLRRYLDDFDRYARIQGWDETRKIDVLPLTLTGIARDAFDGLPASQICSFSGIVEGLRSAFTRASVTDHQLALRSLRYRAEEPLDAFVIRFKKTMNLAFPTVADLSPLLFSHFLATLPQEYYSAVIADGISSFEAAVTKVRNIQCSRAAMGAAPSPSAAVSAVSRDQPVRVMEAEPSVVDALTKRVAELEARLAAVSSQARMSSDVSNRPNRAPRVRGDVTSPVTCHCCGRAGHVRNRCRLRYCRCYVCGSDGHISKVCPQRPQGNDPGSDPPHRVAGRTQ